jgi:hypothetical protein
LVVLEMGISQSICPGGPQTTILPISASQVARITGMSHQYWLDQYFITSYNIFFALQVLDVSIFFP